MDAELLTDMATFAAVVDNNSFSKAAAALNTSKSNVSRRVAALEERLQVKLMNRTTRTLTLTENGRLYYEHCARLVNNAKEADKAIQMVHAVPSGTLNLSLPETLGRKFILPLLPQFLKEYPDISLNLTITSRKVDLAEEGYDVAVRKGIVEDDGLRVVPLGSSTQNLFASPDYLASAPQIATAQDIADHPFLASQINVGPATLELWRGLENVSVRVTPRVAVRDHEAVLRLTLAGLGVALLPSWMAAPYVSEGRLNSIAPEYRGPSVDFNVVFPPQRGTSPNVRGFIKFLTEQFDQNRPWEAHEILGETNRKVMASVSTS